MLPRTADYALRVIVCLARDREQSASAEKLAEETQVPRRYLHKVLQDLVRAEMVRSRSGPGGGYVMTHAPESVSILDVVNAVAPLERIRECPLGIPGHTELCPLHRQLDQSYAATEAAFSSVTIHDILHSSSPYLPLCELSRR